LAKLRDNVSGLMQLLAAAAATVALIVLLIDGWSDLPKEVSLLVYGGSLVLMFLSSAAHHLIKSGPNVSRVLRKADHCSIYLLIAGTYTPICLHFFTGFWQWVLVGVVWGMAAIGIAVKLLAIDAPRWITAGVYLLMGWLSLIAIKQMLLAMPLAALGWLVLGGVFFTIGAVIYVAKRPNLYPGVFGFHELWHVFVILGCLSHFIVIAAFVAPTVA
jgi:hemolysin III